MNDQITVIWSTILDKIKKEISLDSFLTWFENTSLVEIDNDKIVIGVPNKFVKTFIMAKFSKIVETAVAQAANDHLEIEYKIVKVLREKVEEAGKQGVNLREMPSHTNEAQDDTNFSFDETTANLTSPKPSNYKGIRLVPSYTLDNFIVGPSNRIAHSSILSTIEHPCQYNPIFLYGGSGMGKSHILHGLCHELIKKSPAAKIIFISCEEFINDFISHIRNNKMADFREKYRNIDTLVIDDIHFLGQGDKDKTQDEFFHTFDALYNTSCQIIVSSDAPPKDISSLKDKLQMRFISGLVASIEPPNYSTRVKILKQKCKEREYEFPKEVLELIATLITTNVRELEGALTKIHALSSFGNEKISTELVQRALNVSNRKNINSFMLSTDEILQQIAEFFDLQVSEILEAKRGKNAVPRQLAMLVMRKLYSFSYQELCKSFKCKSHASIVHGEKTALKNLEKDPGCKIIYNKLMDHLKENH